MFPRWKRPASGGCGAWRGRARITACASRKACLNVRLVRPNGCNCKDRLLREIKSDADSLRFYYLDETAKQRIEHHGVEKPMDLTEPLIL